MMQDLLAELEAALKAQSPPLTAAFADPATDDAIRDAERTLSATFPDDLKAFLLCANGQQSQSPRNFTPVGDYIVPRLRFAPGEFALSAWGYFLGVDQIVEQTLYHYELDAYADDDEGRQLFGPVTAHHRHIIITAADDPVSLALDPHPAETGYVGQVVTINDQPDYTAFLAPSLSAFLRTLIDGYQAGRYKRQEDGTFAETDGA
jgi:cell wall assembly regulator SMI1